MKGLVKVWVTTLPCRVLVKTKNVVIEEMRVDGQKLVVIVDSLSLTTRFASLTCNEQVSLFSLAGSTVTRNRYKVYTMHFIQTETIQKRGKAD